MGSLFKAPSYSPPPPDPLLEQQRQQAQNDQIAALQQRVQGDSASLMARYGTLAMAGAYSAAPPASAAVAQSFMGLRGGS